jgi:hypothetical protein
VPRNLAPAWMGLVHASFSLWLEMQLNAIPINVENGPREPLFATWLSWSISALGSEIWPDLVDRQWSASMPSLLMVASSQTLRCSGTWW